MVLQMGFCESDEYTKIIKKGKEVEVEEVRGEEQTFPKGYSPSAIKKKHKLSDRNAWDWGNGYFPSLLFALQGGNPKDKSVVVEDWKLTVKGLDYDEALDILDCIESGSDLCANACIEWKDITRRAGKATLMWGLY